MSGGALLCRADCRVVGYIHILGLDQSNNGSARFAGLLDWCASRPQNRCGAVLNGIDHINSYAHPYYRWTGCYLDAKISQPTSDGNRTYQTTVDLSFSAEHIAIQKRTLDRATYWGHFRAALVVGSICTPLLTGAYAVLT